MYRKRTYKKNDRKMFKKTAVKTKAINLNDMPSRGGIRL